MFARGGASASDPEAVAPCEGVRYARLIAMGEATERAAIESLLPFNNICRAKEPTVDAICAVLAAVPTSPGRISPTKQSREIERDSRSGYVGSRILDQVHALIGERLTQSALSAPFLFAIRFFLC